MHVSDGPLRNLEVCFWHGHSSVSHENLYLAISPEFFLVCTGIIHSELSRGFEKMKRATRSTLKGQGSDLADSISGGPQQECGHTSSTSPVEDFKVKGNELGHHLGWLCFYREWLAVWCLEVGLGSWESGRSWGQL